MLVHPLIQHDRPSELDQYQFAEVRADSPDSTDFAGTFAGLDSMRTVPRWTHNDPVVETDTAVGREGKVDQCPVFGLDRMRFCTHQNRHTVNDDLADNAAIHKAAADPRVLIG